MICPQVTRFPGAQRGIPLVSLLGLSFGVVLENSSFLPWREAELELLGHTSLLVFCQGAYFQKRARFGTGRASELSEGWFGLNVDLSLPRSWEDLLSQRDA